MATTVKVKRTHVVLPDDLVAKIDAQVGPRGRSAFLADAARMKLDRDERLRIFDKTVGFLKDNHIPEWDTRESAAKWVHDLRQEWRDPWTEQSGGEESEWPDTSSTQTS